MLGNLTRRPTKSSVTTNTGEMTLKQSHVYPGSLVFADQYESSVPGRRYESFGRENNLDKFKGGTLFYDAMPTLIFINHQTSSCTGDTLASKHKFEAFADLCAVDILGYRADNYIFNTERFIKDCEDLRQSIDFCGVGAHHRNAAERAIQQVVSWARIMVIDAAIHWPDEIDLNLWPMALDHAVYVWNHLPKQGVGLSPMELFTGVRKDRTTLNRHHVWGCPTYVLDPRLHNAGKTIPK